MWLIFILLQLFLNLQHSNSRFLIFYAIYNDAKLCLFPNIISVIERVYPVVLLIFGLLIPLPLANLLSLGTSFSNTKSFFIYSTFESKWRLLCCLPGPKAQKGGVLNPSTVAEPIDTFCSSQESLYALILCFLLLQFALGYGLGTL